MKYTGHCSLFYKATPYIKIIWPYTAYGFSLEVNLNRKYSPVSLHALPGDLMIQGGPWWHLVAGSAALGYWSYNCHR